MLAKSKNRHHLCTVIDDQVNAYTDPLQSPEKSLIVPNLLRKTFIYYHSLEFLVTYTQHANHPLQSPRIPVL